MAINGPVANNMSKSTEEYDSIEEDMGSSESDSLLQAKQASVTFSGGPAEEEPPPDKFWKVYIIFLIFGMCSVLPWNMFITADTYFDHKLRNTTNSTGSKTQLQTMYESYFSVAAQVPNVFVQILNTGLKHRVTLQVRMFTSLTGMLILFIITTVLSKITTDDWQEEFFIITLICVVLINCCGAIFQGSVFGLGGVLPNNYTQALMAGQGLGGILPALLSIITIAALNNPSWSGFVYFLCAVIAIAVTVGAYIVLPKLEFAAFYLNKQRVYTSGRDNPKEQLIESKSFEVVTTRTPPFLAIFKKIWIPAFLVMLTFLVTLGCFPGSTSQIEPLNWTGADTAQYFTPVVCFLLFNVMDFLGRCLSGVVQWPTDKQLWLLSILVILRVMFFPLFAFCNIQPNTRNSSVVFDHDAYPIVFMAVFAISNGYLGSLCMMYGPKRVAAEEHMETAGQMMALFLVIGLALGLVSSDHQESAGVMMSLFLVLGLAIGSVCSLVFVKGFGIWM